METEILGFEPNKPHKHSTLGIISFAFCILAISLVLFSIFNSATGVLANESLKLIFGFTLIISAFISLVTAIIDICKKNRKKVLSFIALVISGGITVLFLLILAILFLFASSQ